MTAYVKYNLTINENMWTAKKLFNCRVIVSAYQSTYILLYIQLKSVHISYTIYRVTRNTLALCKVSDRLKFLNKLSNVINKDVLNSTYCSYV